MATYPSLDELDSLSNEELVSLQESLTRDFHFNAGYVYAADLRSLHRAAGALHRARVYRDAAEKTGLPRYKSEYIAAGLKAVAAAGLPL